MGDLFEEETFLVLAPAGCSPPATASSSRGKERLAEGPRASDGPAGTCKRAWRPENARWTCLAHLDDAARSARAGVGLVPSAASLIAWPPALTSPPVVKRLRFTQFQSILTTPSCVA